MVGGLWWVVGGLIGVLVMAEGCEWARGGGEGTRDRKDRRRDKEGAAWGNGASVGGAPPSKAPQLCLRVGVSVGVGVRDVGVVALRVEECLRAARVVLTVRQVRALWFARGSVVAWVGGGQGGSVRHATWAFGSSGGELGGGSCTY